MRRAWNVNAATVKNTVQPTPIACDRAQRTLPLVLELDTNSSRNGVRPIGAECGSGPQQTPTVPASGPARGRRRTLSGTGNCNVTTTSEIRWIDDERPAIRTLDDAVILRSGNGSGSIKPDTGKRERLSNGSAVPTRPHATDRIRSRTSADVRSADVDSSVCRPDGPTAALPTSGRQTSPPLERSSAADAAHAPFACSEWSKQRYEQSPGLVPKHFGPDSSLRVSKPTRDALPK